ncbi:MAG: NAD(P)/FAD-dependent oxidoreductase [Micromonosporaceae bacterium]
MATEHTYVIVGAGLTGAKAAETLREEGFTGHVILVGEEVERPYERPPLSKGYLLGKDDRSKLYVHDETWYDAQSVQLRVGRRVTAIHRDRHQVELDGGERIGYTKLLLATGSSPRRLNVPGADLDGVHHLRRIEDSERLRDALRAGGPVAVIGAGWIGLETAAAAHAHGCPVTVVEPQTAPLLAALGTEMGGYFADLHRRHGVDLRLRTTVSELRADNGRVAAVVTGDGDVIPAETVVVGVGATPNTALAAQAGLAVHNGIVTDASLRTDDAAINAAGDVANVHHPHYRRPIRVEHWANAVNSGPAAARAMLGQNVVYDRLPYFYTDQYDIGMEFTGWFPPGGYDRVVTHGDLDSDAFYAFWLTGERTVAGMHVNRWDDGIAPVQELIRNGLPINPDRLTDPRRSAN